VGAAGSTGPLQRFSPEPVRPLRLITFLHNQVLGVRPNLATRTPAQSLPAPQVLALTAAELGHWQLQHRDGLATAAALLVALPVFLQAPWVRIHPFSAALATLPLLLLGLALERLALQRPRSIGWSDAGQLLVGFSGSWLGGCLFWGWFRLHPLWHLPIEAFALPLALGGLWTRRWRMAASFYLASLLGTACTDGVMALTGVMGHWIAVLEAAPADAALRLQQAAQGVLEPLPLAAVSLAGTALAALCRRYWSHPDPAWRLAASALATTLAVDGLFLAAALWAPHLSGLI